MRTRNSNFGRVWEKQKRKISTQRKTSKISICTGSRRHCYIFLTKRNLSSAKKTLQQCVLSRTTKLPNSWEITANDKDVPSSSTARRNPKTKGGNCCRDLTAFVAQTRRSEKPLHCRTSRCHPCARPKTSESRPASHRHILRAKQHQPSCGEKQSRRTKNITGCPARSPG